MDWLEIRSVSDEQQVEALECDFNLDSGEANAIVLAVELGANQLLTDERLGRLEAKRQGLRITGILGVLLAAKNQALISEVRPIMNALIQQSNFRIGAQLYDEVLRLAGELVRPKLYLPTKYCHNHRASSSETRLTEENLNKI